MTVTRRTFLRKGAMTVLLTGLALDSLPQILAQQANRPDPSKDFEVPAEAKQDIIFSLTSATFQPYVNDDFTLSSGANSVGATLVAVRVWTPNLKLAKLTPKARSFNSF